jgi:hypothetical protein
VALSALLPAWSSRISHLLLATAQVRLTQATSFEGARRRPRELIARFVFPGSFPEFSLCGLIFTLCN